MYYKVTVLLVLLVKTFGAYQLCEKENSVDITKGNHLTNGDIYYNGLRYQRNEYYRDNETGIEKGCICMKNKCLRKCCPPGLGYDYKKRICVSHDHVFDPPVWDEYRLIRHGNISKMFHFMFGKMNCTLPDYRIRVGQVFKDYHLRMDGQLYIELPHSIPPWTLRGPDKYCIDTFLYEDEDGHQQARLDALVCFAETKEDYASYITSSSCMIISCVFILATVAVYAWLPELRNLHGRVLMAYLLCLFVGFAFLASMQLLLLVDNITPDWCLGMTFVIYFFLLSAFFWLNVMSFDIWWTFSGKRGLAEKLSIRARFCAYALYAFGVPTILTITVAVLEFSPLPPHALLPNIKHHGCFMYGMSKLLYLYGPIVILCVANTAFFVLTAMKIAQIKKQTSVLKSKESAMHDQHRNDKQRLTLYVKLFIVMGINWLLEVISALYPEPKEFWRYTDAYNVLIGLIIFIIFVCKRKIFRMIKKRIKERFQRQESSTGDLRIFNIKDRTNWRNCPNQRASLDTIRSSLGADTVSIKTKTTLC